jgi:hypothetical protein
MTGNNAETSSETITDLPELSKKGLYQIRTEEQYK